MQAMKKIEMDGIYWLGAAVCVGGAILSATAGQLLGIVWAIVATAYCIEAGRNAMAARRLEALLETEQEERL